MSKTTIPLNGGERLEPLSAGFSVVVGNGYTFNTDTILLAHFSMPKKGERCADFGTGCGTIPLLWCARSRPESVYAVEIQHTACAMAERSVAGSELGGTIHVVESDIRCLKESGAVPYDLDCIACNPPYKAAGTGVVSASAGERVARHEVTCSFAEIALSAAAFLRWGGRFCCCMRPERLCGTMMDLRDAGMEPKEIRFVQQRKGTAPFLFLLRAARGGKPGMTVAPVLLIENETGGVSEEMLRIYGDYKEGRA